MTSMRTRSSVVTAAAHCTGPCGWTAGPGPAPGIDRAAGKHTDTGHPTATIVTPADKDC